MRTGEGVSDIQGARTWDAFGWQVYLMELVFQEQNSLLLFLIFVKYVHAEQELQFWNRCHIITGLITGFNSNSWLQKQAKTELFHISALIIA